MPKKPRPSESERPAKSLRLLKTLRRLLGMARPYRWAAWLSLSLVVLGGLLQGAVVPLCFLLTVYTLTGSMKVSGVDDDWVRNAAYHITSHIHMAKANAFLFFAGLLCLAFLLRSIAFGLQIYLSQFFAQRVIFTLRGRLHAHLLSLSSAFFESRRTGDLMSRTTNDVSVLQNVVSVELVDAARAPIIALSSLAVMFAMNAKLTLLSLAVGPIVAYAISRGSRKMRVIAREVQRRMGQLNAHLQERLSAVRVVQIFTREDYEISRFDEINEKNVRSNLRAVKIGAMLNPGVEFIAFLGMLIALLFAGWQMLHHTSDFPKLVGYLFLAQQAGSGLIKLGKVRLAMDQALGAGERVFEILDAESEVKEPPEPIHLPRLKGQIDFSDVSFRYPTGEEVLSNVNLHIVPGEVVALVGPSGAGKTSLVNLIPRFYDPTHGHIEVEGFDIRRVSLHSLRSQIGIVPQETFLFAGTIAENIAYGRLEATREEIIAAANAANADEFVREMPQGYDSPVGERGMRLSGGQRQRIAIARALLKDPRILIMDEPTSSLDMKSEALVLEALARLMVGRTSVVIAHRPSTIKNADRILVLSDGRIVEEGSHHQLISAGGIYSALYEGHFPSLPKAADAT